MSDARKPTIWMVFTFGGGGLLVAAVGAFEADFFTLGQYQILGDHDILFLSAIVMGMASLLAGLVGLAYQSGRQSRATIRAGAIVLAFTTWVIGSLLGNVTVHRPFALLLWPLIAVSIIGIVLILRRQITTTNPRQ